MAQAAQRGGGVTVLEVFKSRVDVALRDVSHGHGEGGLMVGVGDLSGLFHP